MIQTSGLNCVTIEQSTINEYTQPTKQKDKKTLFLRSTEHNTAPKDRIPKDQIFSIILMNLCTYMKRISRDESSLSDHEGRKKNTLQTELLLLSNHLPMDG